MDLRSRSLGHRVFPGVEAFVYHARVSDGKKALQDTGGKAGTSAHRRRIPPWTLAIALWLAAGAAFPGSALLDAATGLEPTGVRLERPLGYLLFSPVFGILDLLTVLTPAQHVAVIVTVLGLFVGFRTASKRGEVDRLPAWKAWTVALAAIVSVYVLGAAVPRPTPFVVASDPDVIRIDFHSHTRHSYDVDSGFTEARNRAWHRRTGFDAAFVSDHRTWQGVREGARSNPARAGDQTVLLSGVEVWFRAHHAIGVGDSARYIRTMDPDRRRFEVDSVMGRPPVRPLTLLFILPGDLDQLTAQTHDMPAGVVGVEVSDGAPWGLHQSRVERGRILQLADSLDLAVVSGSNTHGYGQTAAAWSLMHVQGWRELDPVALTEAIEARIQSDRREAVTVVERPVPGAGSQWTQVFAAPMLAWHLSRVLGTGERAIWLLWLIAAWMLLTRRHREPEPGDTGRP